MKPTTFFIFYHRAIGESYKNKCVCIFQFKEANLVYPGLPKAREWTIGWQK